jgi:hypothetical protein
MIAIKICPFCGKNPTRYGDSCIGCECGASVNINYNYNKDHSPDFAVEVWNKRSLNLTPIIDQVSKIKGQHSAYTDLCAADYKLKELIL